MLVLNQNRQLPQIPAREQPAESPIISRETGPAENCGGENQTKPLWGVKKALNAEKDQKPTQNADGDERGGDQCLPNKEPPLQSAEFRPQSVGQGKGWFLVAYHCVNQPIVLPACPQSWLASNDSLNCT